MLQNGYVRAEFNADGMLEGITTIDDRKKDQVKLVSTRKKCQFGKLTFDYPNSAQ
jgi:hypothetical protein